MPAGAANPVDNQIPADMTGPRTESSFATTAAFDRDGHLWVAWVEGSHILVSHSADQGRTFAPAARVTPAPESIDANGESRPKIAFGAGGEVLVSWTKLGQQPYTGDIRFSRSVDHGRTFSPPVTINDDGLETGHRFDALHVNGAGDVYVAWIDKRDGDRERAAGQDYAGAALYFARSTDAGRTFEPNRKIKDHVCECCRLAVAFDSRDAPVMVWRDILDGTTRDHGIMHFDSPETPGVPQRATTEGWEIDACPHHGPSLSIASDRTYHMTWFTGVGPEGAGAFYARSTDQGKTFSTPIRVGTERAVGHAFVLSDGPRVAITWLEPSGQGRAVHVIESQDSGVSWGPATEVLHGTARSDRPFLLHDGRDLFLSWYTTAEGYRLVKLPRNELASN